MFPSSLTKTCKPISRTVMLSVWIPLFTKILERGKIQAWSIVRLVELKHSAIRLCKRNLISYLICWCLQQILHCFWTNLNICLDFGEKKNYLYQVDIWENQMYSSLYLLANFSLVYSPVKLMKILTSTIIEFLD